MNLYFKKIIILAIFFSILPLPRDVCICQFLGFPGQISDPLLFRMNHQRWGNSNVIPAQQELGLDNAHQKP